MYSEEKINDILDSLVEGTKLGYIKWYLRNSTFNSDTTHHMAYKSDDGKTEFHLKVVIKQDLINLKNLLTPFLYIRNDDLVDDSIQVAGHNFKKLYELREYVFEMYIKPNSSKSTPKKGVLDDILGNINKQYIRQEKIDEILDEKEIKSIEKEVKEFTENRIKTAKIKSSESNDKPNKKPKRKKFLGIF